MTKETDLGVKIEKPSSLRNLNEYFFGEDQGRYLLEIEEKNLKTVEKILKSNNIFFENIGNTQNKYFEINGEIKIDVNELFTINNEWYNSY